MGSIRFLLSNAFPTHLNLEMNVMIMNIYGLHSRKLCEEGLLDFAVCAAAEVSHSCHLNHRGEGHPETRDAGSGIQFLYSGEVEHLRLKTFSSIFFTDISYRCLFMKGSKAATTSGISL